MATLNPLRPAQAICTACAKQQMSIARRSFTTSRHLSIDDRGSHLPRIANPSLWSSLVPKFLRRPSDPEEAAERAAAKAAKPRTRNPYTIFIILGFLIGSNAIQIISLRNDMVNFSRKTDAKLGLLREVVQKVKNGEDVDVKRLLGTGDPKEEREWEEVMKELEGTDMVWEGKKKREAKMVEKAEHRRRKEEERLSAREREGPVGDGEGEAANTRRPKFIM